MNVWVNGRRGRSIDALDRGLQYGDGLFETMCVRRHAVRLLDYHLQRLFEGCRRLRIEAPAQEGLRREIERAAALRADAVLKLIVTRGAGARGYRPTGDERCTRIMALAPPPTQRPTTQPITMRVCRMRLGANPALAGIKTLNRLESVLARSEWRTTRIHEGLLLDDAGQLICGTMSNLFLRRGRTLSTPLLDRCGVAGVMRRWVLGQARRLRLEPVVRRIGLQELAEAEEVFMTNAVAGAMSVAEIRHGRARIRPPEIDTAVQLRASLEKL
jgi:4-amino-4-deoxychorismate lyase